MGLVFLAPAQQATPEPAAPPATDQQAAAQAAQQAAADVAQQAAQQATPSDSPPASPNGLPPPLVTTRPGPAAQPKAGETIPTFKSNSYLVIVDVEATDKAGNPISGLKKEDFTVTEDGKKQDISIFQFQEISQEPEPPEELKLADELKLPEAPKAELTSPTPGQLHFKDKRLMVFYMDFSSMQIPEQLRAQDAALDYLNKFITKDDLVAVVLYTTTPIIETDFTDDRDTLINVIRQLPIGEATDLAGLADTGACTGQDTGAAFVADESEFNVYNTDQKLYAIGQIAKMLKSFPEKKALLYFSSGVSATGVENEAQLEATVNLAEKANMVIYPIDARGLMADPPGGNASTAASRGSGVYSGAVYNAQRSGINASQDTLNSLAVDTGGKMFVDSNNIALGIENVQKAMSSYYLIGYYSKNEAEDGKYRKIDVKLNGGKLAGGKLEFRKGYYADKNWQKMNGEDKEYQLTQALSAGDPVTDIPLVLQYDYFRISPTAYYVPVSIRVPGSVVATAQKGGAAESVLDFRGQVLDDTHAAVQTVSDNIRIKLDGANAERATKGTYQYDAGLTLQPGSYHMKFVVRENISGKMGTFETKFVVPDLSADTSGLKVSSIILSNQRTPVTAAVGSAERASRQTLAANPLVVGTEKVIPNVTRVFRRAQTLYVNFDVYDAQPDPTDTKSRRVKVSMSLFNKNGTKAFEVGPIDATQVSSTRPEAVPVQFQIPLKDIPPGEYTSQITAVDEVSRRFAFPRARIIVR
jgi:VWFA-related protein